MGETNIHNGSANEEVHSNEKVKVENLEFSSAHEKIFTWINPRVGTQYREIPMSVNILVAKATSSPWEPPISTSIALHCIILHWQNFYSLLLHVRKQWIQCLRLLLWHYVHILLLPRRWNWSLLQIFFKKIKDFINYKHEQIKQRARTSIDLHKNHNVNHIECDSFINSVRSLLHY